MSFITHNWKSHKTQTETNSSVTDCIQKYFSTLLYNFLFPWWYRLVFCSHMFKQRKKIRKTSKSNIKIKRAKLEFSHLVLSEKIRMQFYYVLLKQDRVKSSCLFVVICFLKTIKVKTYKENKWTNEPNEKKIFSL